MRSVDVAIVGASLAGAAAARELGRLGVEAVVFDRSHFPREKVCGGFLSPGAVDSLAALGVLNAVRAAGAVEVSRIRVRVAGRERIVQLKRSGIGISRRALDAILAEGIPVERRNVDEILPVRDGARVTFDDGEIAARIVIDAAGKQSRFATQTTSNDFGIQFYDASVATGTMDFWFFRDGYGGAVAVEGGRDNCCFLIRKDALPRWIRKPGCRVTGPIAYDAQPSPIMAVGDAAGMVDPFCGEGMRHALDTGRMAAEIIAEGFHRGRPPEEIRGRYNDERHRRWDGKRRMGRWFREVARRPQLLKAVLGARVEWLLDAMWS